ncbi:hypothetical protein [Bdellovibrio sp. HCB337]|uniref:hypothetical protein n=1 Tax=Bdellovibrio sp. HCB337 TaxID=3394358 RepID=UPI0039A62544
MNKNVIGLLIVVVVAFASFKFGQKSVQAPEADETSAENKAKEDLIELTRADFEEYQKLKTLEERYQKADEILGKVVTLFLADLGLRLAYKPVPASQLQSTCEPCAVNPVNQPPPAPIPTATVTASATPPPNTRANQAWRSLEASVTRERDPEQALNTLRKMEIPDISSTVQGGADLRMRDALEIEGHFTGEIRFFNRKVHKSDWNIEWQIGIKRGAKVNGEGFIRITDKADGKQLSRTAFDSGRLKDFRKADGSRGLIVDVYGGDGYIQIYQLGGSKDVWVGNFYEKVGLGKFEMSGQVMLNRVP